MTHTTFDYSQVIHEQGYRMTLQRQIIMDAICEGHGHVTFEQICARVQRKSPISLPTIYRNLDFLRLVRLIAVLEVGNKTYYEIVSREPHHHLICRNCGRMEQVGPEFVRPLIAKINRDRHFRVETDHLALFGLCRSCRSSRGHTSRRSLS